MDSSGYKDFCFKTSGSFRFVPLMIACFLWLTDFSTGKKGLFFSPPFSRTRILTASDAGRPLRFVPRAKTCLVFSMTYLVLSAQKRLFDLSTSLAPACLLALVAFWLPPAPPPPRTKKLSQRRKAAKAAKRVATVSAFLTVGFS